MCICGCAYVCVLVYVCLLASLCIGLCARVRMSLHACWRTRARRALMCIYAFAWLLSAHLIKSSLRRCTKRSSRARAHSCKPFPRGFVAGLRRLPAAPREA